MSQAVACVSVVCQTVIAAAALFFAWTMAQSGQWAWAIAFAFLSLVFAPGRQR